MQNDIEVIKLAKSGDQNAMGQLLIENKPLVASIARRYFLLGGDQEDLIQEGMIGLFKAVNIYDVNKNDNFGTFAGKIIEREIISAIRKENTNKNQVLDNSVLLDDQDFKDDTYPELEVIQEENLKELTLHIDKQLSQLESKVMELYLKGYSYIDISEILKKSPKAIDNALTRIKNKLNHLRGNL